MCRYLIKLVSYLRPFSGNYLCRLVQLVNYLCPCLGSTLFKVWVRAGNFPFQISKAGRKGRHLDNATPVIDGFVTHIHEQRARLGNNDIATVEHARISMPGLHTGICLSSVMPAAAATQLFINQCYVHEIQGQLHEDPH